MDPNVPHHFSKPVGWSRHSLQDFSALQAYSGHRISKTLCMSIHHPQCVGSSHKPQSSRRFVKPQHFLPVHGEYSFLCEHARLARETAGVNNVEVIKNGQMLGVHERMNRNQVSQGARAAFHAEGIDMFLWYTVPCACSWLSMQLCQLPFLSGAVLISCRFLALPYPGIFSTACS